MNDNRTPVYIHGGTDPLYWIEETDLGAEITDANGEPLVRLTVKGAHFVGHVLQQIAKKKMAKGEGLT